MWRPDMVLVPCCGILTQPLDETNIIRLALLAGVRLDVRELRPRKARGAACGPRAAHGGVEQRAGQGHPNTPCLAQPPAVLPMKL
jgi:hypothetical protein